MLVTLGIWVVLVAMVVCPMLVVPVAVLLVAPWDHVVRVAMQMLPRWWQEALAAVAIARTT